MRTDNVTGIPTDVLVAAVGGILALLHGLTAIIWAGVVKRIDRLEEKADRRGSQIDRIAGRLGLKLDGED